MKHKKTKIAIISRESDSRTLDIAMLEAELLRRGCEVKVLSRLLTKEKSVKALGYIGEVIKQEAAILAADVVVLDTYCIPASMIPHRRGTKVVQMWHALAAIKKFGWQTVGKEGGSSEKTARLMRMHRGYDYVVCASDVTAGHFCEAFDVGRDKIVKYGLPRIDYVKSVALGDRRDDMRRRIFTKYPELRGGEPGKHGRQDSIEDGESTQKPQTQRTEKRTILYAPTFRPGRAVDVQSLTDALDPDRFNLVVKLHPLYRQPQAAGTIRSEGRDADSSPAAFGEPGGAVIIYDEEFSSFDWLSAADIIISDYSSFVIESTLADKPLYIYAYDLEEYDGSTGLNVDFENEPIASYVFRDAPSLARCIEESVPEAGTAEDAANVPYDFDALRAFRDRYIDIDTGTDAGDDRYCTAALADFIERAAGRV